MGEKAEQNKEKEDGSKKGQSSHNPLEKAVFGVGLLIILSILGYLGYLIFQERKQPPQLVVMTAYKPKLQNYTYEVRIKNFGEETATNANIKLSLYQGGKVVESGTISVNYIPIKSTETAWAVFHRERQATDSLVVSSITFVKP